MPLFVSLSLGDMILIVIVVHVYAAQVHLFFKFPLWMIESHNTYMYYPMRYFIWILQVLKKDGIYREYTCFL